MKSKNAPNASEPTALVNSQQATAAAEAIQTRIDAHVAKLVKAGLSAKDALADAKAHIEHDAVVAAEKAAREIKAAAAAAKKAASNKPAAKAKAPVA